MEPMTVRDLRRRWKPTKDALIAEDRHESLRVRIHRACSWLERAQATTDDVDAQMFFHWSAFSALFTRWDDERRRPLDERESIGAFLTTILELDRDGHIDGAMQHLRPVAADIFDDAFLAGYFWDEPGSEREATYRRSTTMMKEWLERGRLRPAFDRLFERVGLLRAQLADGAASAGSRLNRNALARCNELLAALVPAFLLVLIDCGTQVDWGDLCYPPQHKEPAGGAG